MLGVHVVCWRVSAMVPKPQDRTRSFARLMGPWLVLVPGIIVLRAHDMGPLAADFFRSSLFVWFAGALLLFLGLLIIAFHQYWSSVAAVIISVLGWILVARGLVLMAAPKLYEKAATYMPGIVPIRILFGILVVIGLYLMWVGWLARPDAPGRSNRQ